MCLQWLTEFHCLYNVIPIQGHNRFEYFNDSGRIDDEAKFGSQRLGSPRGDRRAHPFSMNLFGTPRRGDERGGYLQHSGGGGGGHRSGEGEARHRQRWPSQSEQHVSTSDPTSVA